MYVQGPPAESTQAPGGFIDPRTDPEFFQDSDNLGFSLARFKINKKSFTRPLATVKKNALVTAGIAAAFIPIPGVGMLAPKLLGGVKSLVGGAISKVTGRGTPAAPAVQRMSAATIDAAGPNVDLMPLEKPPLFTMPVQRVASTTAQLLALGGKARRGAGSLASGVTKAADIAGALAKAAGDVGAAGDQIGSKQLADAAAKIAELARTGQDTATNVAGVINQGGAAVQGAVTGAMAGAGTEQAAQGISAFLSTTTGKVTAAVAVAGGAYLFMHHSGPGGGGGSVQHWD